MCLAELPDAACRAECHRAHPAPDRDDRNARRQRPCLRRDDGSVYFKIASFPGIRPALSPGRPRTPARDGRFDRRIRRETRSRRFRTLESAQTGGRAEFLAQPVGRRPAGWHLECSAMALEYLGETFDLHSGGVDLIFPHHENEIAQSRCATGREMCRHWFHITHLLVDGRKMSKSLGNLYTLDDLAALGHDPAAVRYVLLSGHYRQPLSFTLENLAGAKSALHKLAKFDAALEERCSAAARLAPRTRGPTGIRVAPRRPECPTRARPALHRRQRHRPRHSRPRRSRSNPRRSALPARRPRPRTPARSRTAAGRPGRRSAPWLISAGPPASPKDWATADALRAQLTALGWTMSDGKENYSLAKS